MQTTTFNVTGVNNPNSANTIKSAVNSVQGVSNCSVDVNESKVTVTYDPSTADLNAIKSAISNTGFTVL